MDGIDVTKPTTSTNNKAATEATSKVALQPDATLPSDRLNQDGEANKLQRDADKAKEPGEENLALCGTLGVQPSQESSNGWRPPRITQEFGYPSDE